MAKNTRLISALKNCDLHITALNEALKSFESIEIGQIDFDNLTPEQRRLFDQFAYRFIRLQDDMGAKLFPGILESLGEEYSSLSMIDRLNRLEQLEYIESTQEWIRLREIRNDFTHDYPEDNTGRRTRFQAALEAVITLMQIFQDIHSRLIQKNIIPPLSDNEK